MSNKHKNTLGQWARENGHKKWEEAYHPENKEKRRLDGIKYYNRRHSQGDYKSG